MNKEEAQAFTYERTLTANKALGDIIDSFVREEHWDRMEATQYVLRGVVATFISAALKDKSMSEAADAIGVKFGVNLQGVKMP